MITVDFEDVYQPDIVADVLELSPEATISALGGSPTLVPREPAVPRVQRSAQMGRNWTRPHPVHVARRYPHLLADTEPRTPKAALGLALVQATLDLVEDSGRRGGWSENPVGKLRKLGVVAGVPRRTVTYCRYLRPFRKPTDLWGVAPPSMIFERPCDAVGTDLVDVDGVAWRVSPSTGLPCDESAPRGSALGTQGRKRLDSTAVPYALAWDVLLAAERDWSAGLAGETAGQEAMFA